MVERAVATGQADAVTFTLCADFSLMLADPAGAVRCADTALEREPTNPHARAMRGEALIKLGTVDKGIAELDAATAASPGDAELWRRSARVLQGLGKNAEALARYARVREIVPRDAEALLASAEIHLALGELDQARTIALSLVGSPAQESRGQYVLGRIALKQEKADEAVIAFARATKLDAKNGPAWAGLAEAYLALEGRAQGARRAGRRSGAARCRRGRLPPARRARDQGRAPAQAVAPLERAVVLLPGDYHLRLAQARTLAALDRWQDAANSAREAQKLEPKSIEALLLGAEAAYRQGKNGEAIETLEARAGARGRFLRRELQARPQLRRQRHLRRSAEAPRARRTAERPRRRAARGARARCCCTQRSYDAAIASFTKAVALNGSDANKRELERRLRPEEARGERGIRRPHRHGGPAPRARVRLRRTSSTPPSRSAASRCATTAPRT